MKLDAINLTNFRAFKQLELKFDDQLTVIAGINGIGKSSILTALREMTAQYHKDRNDDYVDGSPFSVADFKRGTFRMTADVRYKGKIITGSAQALRAIPTPAVWDKVTKEIDKLTIQQSETKRGSKDHKALEEKLRFQKRLLYGDNEFRTQNGSITSPSGELEEESTPLMIYFGTSRFLSRFAPAFKPVKAFSRADAFAGALDDSEVSVDLFAKWFRAVESGKVGGKRRGNRILKSLNELIARMLPEFHYLKFFQDPKPHFTITKGFDSFELEELSDGERAILSLCFDVTRRLAIANPDSNCPTEEGIAIILIDEIELHLHPKWQRQILRNLLDAFPACQFVVTTHSALVLSEVEAPKIRFLELDEDAEKIEVCIPDESFGLDVNRILDELMGASERNKKVMEDLNELFRLIDDEKFVDARRFMKPLAKLLGDNEPELTRASALIKFLEGKE